MPFTRPLPLLAVDFHALRVWEELGHWEARLCSSVEDFLDNTHPCIPNVHLEDS